MLTWTVRTLLVAMVAFLLVCAMGALPSAATAGGSQSTQSPVVIPSPERPSIALLGT